MGASPGSGALSLREAVIAWLKSLSTLTSIVGSRVYFSAPSQISSYPCVAVKVSERSWGRNLSGADGTSTATVEIDGLGLTESSCIAIAEAIRNNFDGFRGTQSGLPILSNYYTEESDDIFDPVDGSDQHIYSALQKYRVKHRVPLPTSVTQTNV